MDIEISVVVPVYGCRAALPELHRRLVETLESMSVSFEIILVEDNCPQKSWESIAEICKIDDRVIGIHLARNFGQIQAITAGLDHSRGNWVVVMDCDLQDRPEFIPQLYAKAQEGYDVVFAQRENRKDNALTQFFSRAFYRVYDYFTNGRYDNSLSNFSISRRDVVDYYCRMREHQRAYTMFIKWLGFRQTAIPLESDERFEGHSSYNFSKKIRMAGDIITAQSNKPLKFAMNIGFVVAAIAFIYLIILVVNKVINPEVAMGWTSTIGAIFLMGGLNLAGIGIVGLYVGNIFTEVKARPLYVIQERLNMEPDEIERTNQ